MRSALDELCALTRFPARRARSLSGRTFRRTTSARQPDARARCSRPKLLLLDEPLGALDPLVRAALQKDLKEIFPRLQQTAILVTHDLAEAAYLGDEIVLMNEGRIVQKRHARRTARTTRERFRDRIHQRATEPRTWNMRIPWLLAWFVLIAIPPLSADRSSSARRNSPNRTCSAEIAKHSIEDAGITVEHRQGMGGTIILWQALRSGQIDLYPEYTGTIARRNSEDDRRSSPK